MKTNKKLKIFIKSLIKYADEKNSFSVHFKPEEIPIIFKGFSESDFNKIYHGIGKGCCTYLPLTGYQINIDHCHLINNRFIESRKSTIRIILIALGVGIAILFGVFNLLNLNF